MASFGEVLETWMVGAVTVKRRYGCARRDQYEITSTRPFPAALRALLAPRGEMRGSDALYVLDAKGDYQLTVAPGAGRALLMPRMTTPPARQRAAAEEISALIASTL